jgi:hypothetical protein
VRNIAIRVGLLAAIGVGALVARPFLSGNVGELQVGDCFDIPAVTETVDDIQRHPCTDVHGGEVFFVGEHAAADSAPYPTEIALSTEIETACVPAFNAYTGLDALTDPTWTLAYFYPVSAGWAEGDRGFICYAARIDGTTTNTSLKKA